MLRACRYCGVARRLAEGFRQNQIVHDLVGAIGAIASDTLLQTSTPRFRLPTVGCVLHSAPGCECGLGD